MNTSSSRPSRRLILLIIVAAVLLGGLALDLAQRGFVWQVFWSLTGEETPLSQLRGMLELTGNLTRPQPHIDPYVPVQHAGVYPFGINTFLEQEVEPAKREQSLQMIRDAGFGWIRQQFPWADIEIHARGDFEDRRNDLDGDGTPDAISAWAKYDHIAALAQQFGIDIHARLDNPPEWAQSIAGDFAPPADVQDFVNYAVAVAERYRGQIRYYQVWNEPNIYPEWGEQNVDPEAFTDLLCRTYDALKAVDPQIVVIAPPLSPTVSLTGRDLNDFIYLQRMYSAGAGACFDVLAAQGYGFNSGPADRRLSTTSLTFARSLYLREMMVANGDAHKPIWITELAWNPIDSPDVPPDVSARENYGVATQAQAAAYLPLAYERAQREWPWVGVMHYWFFKRAADFERGQSWYYFRMVEPDFTPLPVYDSIRAYIADLTPALYRGVHQGEHWAIDSGESELVTHAEAQFGEAVRMNGMRFTAYGTGLRLRWHAAGESVPVEITVNDSTWLLIPGFGWNEETLAFSVLPQTFTVTTEDAGWLLDSVIVYDYTTEHVLAIVVVTLIIIMLPTLILMWRRRRAPGRA